MVEKHLTPELILEGSKLLQVLDDAGVAPDSALWLYSSDASAWKLLISHVKVGVEGPRDIYRAVQKALQRLRNEVTHLDLDDVTVAKSNAPMIALLSKTISGPGMSGIRLARNVVDGTLIEDAYIYRLKGAA